MRQAQRHPVLSRQFSTSAPCRYADFSASLSAQWPVRSQSQENRREEAWISMVNHDTRRFQDANTPNLQVPLQTHTGSGKPILHRNITRHNLTSPSWRWTPICRSGPVVCQKWSQCSLREFINLAVLRQGRTTAPGRLHFRKLSNLKQPNSQPSPKRGSSF